MKLLYHNNRHNQTEIINIIIFSIRIHQMNNNPNLKIPQYITILLASKDIQMNIVFQLIQKINNSSQSSKECITILQDIFNKECSTKILLTVQLLQYLVKNCNRNFHQVANSQSFQKSILKLLRRQRGKFSLVEKLRSNLENWAKIQAKILYIIQLWYDAFMLQQSKYHNIINNYKILRKQGIIFPPRRQQQKNMMFVKTQSPIFDHISEIAMSDRQKFNKKKIALQFQNLEPNHKQKVSKSKMSLINQFQQKLPKENLKKTSQYIDLDQVQNLIAIIRSLDHRSESTNLPYEKLKHIIENNLKPPNINHMYNEIMKQAQKVVYQWQNKLKESVINQQQQYMKKKLGTLKLNQNRQELQKSKEVQIQQKIAVKIPEKQIDLLDL